MAGRAFNILGGSDYISNYRFQLSIGRGLLQGTMGFSKVSGLSLEQSFDEIREGGVNDYAHLVASPNAVGGTLVLERGVTSNGLAILQFRPGVSIGTCTVTAMRKGKGSVSYEVNNAIISKWEIGEMDAMGNHVLIHKMEIKYYGLKMLKNPFF